MACQPNWAENVFHFDEHCILQIFELEWHAN